MLARHTAHQNHHYLGPRTKMNEPSPPRRRIVTRSGLSLLAVLSVLAAAQVDAQGPPPRDALRQLYFKLPLTQPRFHWRFSDVEAFLGGRLTLRIIRDGVAESIVVFDQGVISQGWAPIGSGPPDEIYFGFRSSRRYMTTVRDSLEIELVAAEDLWGIGDRISGFLPAGTYRATGSYSHLTGYASDRWLPVVSQVEQVPLEVLEAMPETQALVKRLNDMPNELDSQAIMECWRQAWPLEPRGAGWLSPKEVAEHEASESEIVAQLAKTREMLREAGGTMPLLMGLGTDGRPCRGV